MTEQTYTVSVEKQNVVAETGYAIGLETVAPQTITVNGPNTEIQKVKSAVVRYSQEGKVSKNFSVKQKVTLLDADGKEINMTKVTVTPSEVDISVPVLKRKTLPMTLEFLNAPDGFAESDYFTINPQKIEIAGPAEVVDNMSSFQIGTLDLSKYITSDSVFLPIGKREGISIISDTTQAEVKLNYSRIKNKKMTMKVIFYYILQNLYVSHIREICWVHFDYNRQYHRISLYLFIDEAAQGILDCHLYVVPFLNIRFAALFERSPYYFL
jgi:YbbR domain-containing protein